jgi:hypothetical protein
VNEPAQSEGARPSVLAIGVTPLQAMQAYEALLEVVPRAELRVLDEPPAREQYSHYADRVRFVALDPTDPIESQLLVSYAAHSKQTEELLSQSPVTSRFIDPFSVVVVVVGTVAADTRDEAGGEPPNALARLVRNLRRSTSQPGSGAGGLGRLLRGLGKAYGGGFPGPVLVSVAHPGITFVAEPGLPSQAIQLAAQLVTIPGQDMSHLPVRWSEDLGQWVPLDGDWTEQAALRRLATEIQVKLPPPAGR